MSGKVNPVIPEALNIACFQIIANNLAVTLAADAGQLQLNAIEPLIAFKLFESLDIMGNALQMFQDKCISILQANPERCHSLMQNSIGIITALNPYLGYETTTRLAKTAFLQGNSVLDLIQAEQLIPAEQIQ